MAALAQQAPGNKEHGHSSLAPLVPSPPHAPTHALTTQEHVVALVQQALEEAGITPTDIGCIAYTKVRTVPRL